MGHYCNPVNINYRYQFHKERDKDKVAVAREAADPSMILFKGKYYIFASMTLGVWVSDDILVWESHRLPDNLPLYDYAPDVRVMGEYVYFSASKKGEICDYYRTKDILNGPYERIEGTFDFWDPNLFLDEDGRVYFYWGCSNMTPIWGVELDPITMKPLGEKSVLIVGKPEENGYERIGEDHDVAAQQEGKKAILNQYIKQFDPNASSVEQLPEEIQGMLRSNFGTDPFIEGAWMDKYQGKYYLQYSCPGTEYNVYADGVYISDSPLGPFKLAKNNPYSYKPGGYIPGAGHGSSMKDKFDNLWHASTMRISMNHIFERRVGIWPAGFDTDGELFCNQRYGDWPIHVEQSAMDPWRNPDWYLLSYNKKTIASSAEEGKGPEFIVDENIQTWWRAESEEAGQWLEIDLAKSCDVHAIQINFADDIINVPVPGEIRGTLQPRYIEEAEQVTQWVLEGSEDGESYQILEDKSEIKSCLPHDLVVIEEGIRLRYIRLVIKQIPYNQKPCISGLRVFGICEGKKPDKLEFDLEKVGDLDMDVIVHTDKSNIPVTGYNILWGHSPEKLYHSYMVFGKCKQRIGALVKGETYYVRVDAFNGSGITEGNVRKL